jgi:hypothetical protein
MKGGTVLQGTPTPAHLLAGLTVESRGRRRTILANLCPETISAAVGGITGGGSRARVQVLDETNVERACRSPDIYRAERGAVTKLRKGALEIELLPYAVARIDWEE